MNGVLATEVTKHFRNIPDIIHKNSKQIPALTVAGFRRSMPLNIIPAREIFQRKLSFIN